MPPSHDNNAAVMLKLETVEEKVDLIHKILTGNGTPERGLVIRVDRLEQSEARRAKVIGVAVAASAGALIKAFWATISGGNSHT